MGKRGSSELSVVRCDKVCVKMSYQQSKMGIKGAIAIRNKL